MAEVVTNSSARGTRRYTPATATVAPYHAKKKKKEASGDRELSSWLSSLLLWSLGAFFFFLGRTLVSSLKNCGDCVGRLIARWSSFMHVSVYLEAEPPCQFPVFQTTHFGALVRLLFHELLGLQLRRLLRWSSIGAREGFYLLCSLLLEPWIKKRHQHTRTDAQMRPSVRPRGTSDKR